jgi:SAM-dependent methyltransferase
MRTVAGAHARAATATQYDAIAGQYQRSRRSPIRRFIESYTLLGLIGPVEGFDVLDLACGEGFYTRELHRRGACRVVGMDISPAMISLAREQQVPSGVEYRVGAVEDMPDIGRFDLVVAAYLLHYARDVSTLHRMCQRIATCLPPGGRFVALNENPEQCAEQYAGYAQYGFSKTVELPRREGSVINYTLVAGRQLFSFEAFHYARSTYERALTEAGFGDIRWHPMRLDPAGEAELGTAYWQEYLRNPPVTGLECRRQH